MNYFKLFAVILSFSLLACTENKPTDDKDLVPKSVVDFFEKTAKDPKNTEWHLEGENFKVSYTYKNQEKYLIYNSQNKIIDKRTEVNPDLFSPQAEDVITQEYQNAKDIKRYAGQRGNELYFVATFKLDNTITTLIFNQDGEVIEIEKTK